MMGRHSAAKPVGNDPFPSQSLWKIGCPAIEVGQPILVDPCNLKSF